MFVSKVDISLNENEENVLLQKNYTKIDVDLNKNARGNYIYLWYKKECNPCTAITRIQFSFKSEMETGLMQAGYTKIEKDLNAGARGDYIYLWYFCGNTEFDQPITDLHVTVDAAEEKLQFSQKGWEKSSCDLNRGNKGNWIYLWMKRETEAFVQDLAVTTQFGEDQYLLSQGYTRVDDDLNRGAGGAYVFLWWRKSTEKNKPVTGIDVSTDPEQELYLQRQGYTKIPVDCNKGARGNYIYIWYHTSSCDIPLTTVTISVKKISDGAFEEAGLTKE
ncbi:uncharacterized protein si:dkey-30j10.5 isoform X2 [Acipenser ruthenus]|uniref:uncharacterized protein si:dkey-30j10.5 isoform X2 n=1 Tax=Acipenser ruthenus TaxID=7906 RepID=UPI0027425AB7|nr:uncharacterized protein si:dkey-30j10.5 isoform X2 [Acipenser ruthenus]